MGRNIVYPDGVLSYNPSLELSYPVLEKPSLSSCVFFYFYTSTTLTTFFSPDVGVYFPHNTISLNSDTNYLEIASESIG